MRYLWSVLFLASLGCITTHGVPQEFEKKQYFVVPSEVGLLVIAPQPDCPLRFEDAKLLFGPHGSSMSYRVRNTGTKAVRSFRLARWTSSDTGSTWDWPSKPTNQLVKPENLVPFPDEEPVDIVPLTDELRDKFQVRGPMQAVVILMVVRIEFADGTIYSADSTLKALQGYMRKISDAVLKEYP